MLEINDYRKIIRTALFEDFRKIGDITSQSIFNDKEECSFILISKDSGILCGKDIFSYVFKVIDKNSKIIFNFNDGDKINNKDIVARVSGKTISILKGERTALNIISHLSGISTKTSKFVEKINNKSIIIDTRKTLPGLRKMQKYAVLCGGGQNHRMGLYDMILIKDNHIDACGSIKKAVLKVRNKYKNKFKIEVEARNLEDVKEALDLNVTRIMLDNMNCDDMKKACELINNRVETEASGNISLENVKKVSDTGVDYISVGELTHSVTVFDFSLKKEK